MERSRVVGWIEKRNVVGADGAPARAWLTVDGVATVEIEPTEPRADVAAECLSVSPLTGFSIDLGALLPAGASADVGASVSIDLGLRCEATDLSHLRTRVVAQPTGYVDGVANGKLFGWAVRAPFRSEPCTVEVRIDGVLYSRVRADRFREDLQTAGLARGIGGWEVPLVFSPDHGRTPKIEAFVLPERFALPSIHHEFPPVEPADRLPTTIPDPVDVAIVVVARPGAALEACIAAVVEHTRAPARLFVVDDDGTTITRLPEAVRALPNLRVVPRLATRSAIDLTGDVVLLDPDVVVGPRWLENLASAAHAGDEVASAEAMSEGVELAAPAAVADRARRLAKTSTRIRPAAVLERRRCLYLRADALAVHRAAGFDFDVASDEDLVAMAAWLRHRGRLHLCDDATFVGWVGDPATPTLAPDTSEASERGLLGETLGADFPALAAAHRLRASATASEGVSSLPRALFVVATLGGGTPATNRDLMSGLGDRWEGWLLHCDAEVMTLSRLRDGSFETVRVHRLRQRIEPITHRSAEYERVLAGWLVFHAIELVHVRHLAWHSLGLPALCRRLGIPTVNSFHDYYAVCPSLKLLDERLAHCGGHCTAGEGVCQIELWPETAFPPLKNAWVNRWRNAMGDALAACDAFVTTSERARALIVEAHPFLAERDFRVIPHGRDFDEMVPPREVGRIDGPCRILVPGSISVAKGARVIAALRDFDTRGVLEFHVLGDADPSLTGERIVHHGAYERGEFATRARTVDAHLGAIFSIWPETHCHTLTELWNLGLPVVALDFGAVAERIRESGAGVLLPHDEDAGRLFRAITALVDDLEARRRLADAVTAWQGGRGRAKTVSEMAGRYAEFYEAVAARRKAFGTGDPALRQASLPA